VGSFVSVLAAVHWPSACCDQSVEDPRALFGGTWAVAWRQCRRGSAARRLLGQLNKRPWGVASHAAWGAVRSLPGGVGYAEHPFNTQWPPQQGVERRGRGKRGLCSSSRTSSWVCGPRGGSLRLGWTRPGAPLGGGAAWGPLPVLANRPQVQTRGRGAPWVQSPLSLGRTPPDSGTVGVVE